ncbi:hypothetical protein F4703DRAFT_1945479, partial [Phycomyces blakesleeanus]
MDVFRSLHLWTETNDDKTLPPNNWVRARMFKNTCSEDFLIHIMLLCSVLHLSTLLCPWFLASPRCLYFTLPVVSGTSKI